jgi:hypothetical protein
MLKNCVFRADVDTRQWIHAAGRRAIKTMAQTFVATIGSAAVMGEVNWPMVASASVLSGILSVATSIAGLPELSAKV